MRQDGLTIALLSAIFFFSPGCVPESGIDKAKFSELNRTARELQTAFASGTPCDMPAPLLQKIESEIAALNGKAASQDERDLAHAYSSLVTTYKDAMLLCKYRAHLSQFPFVPKGRIYVFQELDPLVEKYDLPTEKHLYLPTGLHWRSINGNSIQVIWERAEIQLKNIDHMVKYH